MVRRGLVGHQDQPGIGVAGPDPHEGGEQDRLVGPPGRAGHQGGAAASDPEQRIVRRDGGHPGGNAVEPRIAGHSDPIGGDSDPMAVLDSRFRVRGVNGLRVVDASVFPRIPGTFIVLSIYMVSERAADVLLEDAGMLVK